MAVKTRIKIDLSEGRLGDVDALAKEFGLSRTEAIRRLMDWALDQDLDLSRRNAKVVVREAANA